MCACVCECVCVSVCVCVFGGGEKKVKVNISNYECVCVLYEVEGRWTCVYCVYSKPGMQIDAFTREVLN